MEATTLKEISNLLAKSQRILIVSRGGKDGDVIASMVALREFLAEEGKSVDLLAQEAPDPRFAFLPGAATADIPTETKKTDRFTIVVDTSHAKPSKLSYEMQDNKLQIFISAKEGEFRASDVSFAAPNLACDLIITLGLQDLDNLGALYERHTELFYNTPIINIDTKASNEYFGEINVVEVKTTSLTEVLASLFSQLDVEKITESIATSLLTGMIYKTNSFQNISTTPKTFTIAAQLVAKGANQQEIVKHLFKTKPLEVLKLWGRVLARIQSLPEKKALWSVLTQSDFEKTNTTPETLRRVLDELENTTENRDIIVILYEEAGKIKGVVRARKHSSAIHMAEKFSGGLGTKREAYFEMKEKEFADAETVLIGHLKTL